MTQANVLRLQQEGISQARAGNKTLARQLLLEASKLEPNNKSTWLWLAVVASAPEDSVAYLHQALALSPGNPQIMAALQQAEARVQQQTAVSAWNCPLCNEPANEPKEQCPSCRAVLSLSNIEQLLNNQIANRQRLETAVSQLKQAVDTNPDDVRAHYKLALIHFNLHDTTTGLDHLRRAHQLQPNNAFLQTAVANIETTLQPTTPPAWICPICLHPADQPTDFCPTCHALLTLTDIDAVINNQEAKRDCIQNAARRLKRENEATPDVRTLYKLALAHLNLGEVDAGIKQLNAGLALQPDNRSMRALVTLLLQRQAKTELTKTKAAPAPTHKGVILVVDDSPTIRKLVSMTLEEAGYSVVVAADGMQALSKLNGHSSELNGRLPNLILLDITMPRMDGYQVCKIIKGYKETKSIPVVMLSGKDGFFDKVRGRIAGSTDYVTKPFQAEGLIETVNKHVK